MDISITPTRSFNLLYIILDSLFILVLLFIFIYKKKKDTLYFSLFGGILYFIVDFGYFYYLSKTRTVYISGNICNAFKTGLVLLWMSLSYGITNFAFIWLCLKRDKDLKEILIMIIGWWLVVPSIATLGGKANIMTYRTTSEYHSFMAIILVIGYSILLIYNLFNAKGNKIDILRLNLIGISVQFCWEFALLVNGIRPMNSSSITTLIINSLIETNLGMPIIYGIMMFFKKHQKIDTFENSSCS